MPVELTRGSMRIHPGVPRFQNPECLAEASGTSRTCFGYRRSTTSPWDRHATSTHQPCSRHNGISPAGLSISQSLFDALQYQDPLHVLLQYIAEVSTLLVIARALDCNRFCRRHLIVIWHWFTMTTSHLLVMLYVYPFVHQSCCNPLTL